MSPKQKETSEAKKKRKEQENAEKKLEELIDKRNEFNDIARQLREEREILNAQKRELGDEIRKLKERRAACVEKMRAHKEKRNAFQAQARNVIKQKRERARGIDSRLPADVNLLRTEIRELEFRQQTTPMSLEKDREIIEKIKAKQRDLKNLSAELTHQVELDDDIKEINQVIDKIFERADEEHADVVRLYNESQSIHEKIMEHSKEMRFLITESNKKHQDFLKVREKADKVHQRVVAMLEKLNGIRAERREKFKEAQKIFLDYKDEIAAKLDDTELRRSREEDALKGLFSGKPISLQTLTAGMSGDGEDNPEDSK